MTITSVGFLVFLLITFCVFYLFPVKERWVVLLLASIVFYVLAGAVYFLPFILFSALIVWLCARKIGQLYDELKRKLEAEGLSRFSKKELQEKYRIRARRYLVLALILCFGVLCVTKFVPYLIQFLNQTMPAADGSPRFSAAWILVPLGISYYTFSTAGYLLDVYWKRYRYESNFARFFLYAIYFPHIVQGPISRYNLLGRELKKELRFDSRRVLYGIELMLWGFFKKMVIADRLSIFVSAVYDGGDHVGSVFLVAAIFDAFQIYTDFSGYMDIVRGASQIFGVELENNFDHPFFSETVPEFWRRWHITLGAWFKDYVYYPFSVCGWMKSLGRKIKKHFPAKFSRLFLIGMPMLLTWVLTGLWHGTGISYLCWGLYYGILITISGVFAPEFRKINHALRIRTDSFSWKLFRKVRTFFCFVGGRMLTSPGSLRYGLLIVKTIFCGFAPWCLLDGTLYSFGLNAPNFWLAVLCLILLWAVSMLQKRFSLREKLSEQNIVFRWGILYLAIFSILIFGIYGIGYDSTAFIYERF